MEALVRALTASWAEHAPLDVRRLLLAGSVLLVLFAAYRLGRHTLMALAILVTVVAVKGGDEMEVEAGDDPVSRAPAVVITV